MPDGGKKTNGARLTKEEMLEARLKQPLIDSERFMKQVEQMRAAGLNASPENSPPSGNGPKKPEPSSNWSRSKPKSALAAKSTT